jgi:hypothetical protein
MTTITVSKIGEKLRKLAEAMPEKIEHLRRPMTQNSTPKRQREYASRVIDGDNLERGRLALLALADAHDRGDVPEVLKSLAKKDDICRLVRHGTDSTGYYSVFSTHKYADQSEAGKAMQVLLDASIGKESAEAQAATKKKREIEALIERVRFSDIPGFFPTPDPVIRMMLERADIKPGMRVLEPSAGIGSIADAVRAIGAEPLVCEVNYTLQEILKAKGYEFLGRDFMDVVTINEKTFDAVIMNPPFERGQDILHVMHAFDFLKHGGRLVAIVSTGPFFRSDRKSEEFRDWIGVVGAEVIELPDGSFQGAGAFRQTGISCKMLVLDK